MRRVLSIMSDHLAWGFVDVALLYNIDQRTAALGRIRWLDGISRRALKRAQTCTTRAPKREWKRWQGHKRARCAGFVSRRFGKHLPGMTRHQCVSGGSFDRSLGSATVGVELSTSDVHSSRKNSAPPGGRRLFGLPGVVGLQGAVQIH